MDFASLMKSQIVAAQPAKSVDNSGNKYLKRSDIENQRQAQYLKEQEELEAARLARIEKKRRRDEEEAEHQSRLREKKKKLGEESRRITEEQELAEENLRRQRLGLSPISREVTEDATATLQQGEEDVAEDELLKLLLDLQQPRHLFGETHVQRLRRYRQLTEKKLVYSTGPIPTTIELLPEADMRVPERLPDASDAPARKLLARQLASYFDMVLSEWSRALSRRDEQVKQSFAGKQAHNAFVAARDNLVPLFRKLETDNLAEDLVKAILNIVNLAQQRRYVHANDAYLTLSIGKAAWPIGVTMVGIHERSAREKLHESENNADRAHILSDETTRKMLQGIKRCLSFAQTRWPPEDIGQLMG